MFIPASNEPSGCLQTFGDCREGQMPRPLGRLKFDAPLLAAGFLTGRKAELQFLENRYHAKGGQLIVLYGRHRVGKTETLKQFCQGKSHVFFPWMLLRASNRTAAFFRNQGLMKR